MTIEHRLDGDNEPYRVDKWPRKATVDPAVLASLDVRIGTVVDAVGYDATRQPSMILTVDFGPQVGRLATCAKVANYERQEIIGRQVAAVVNLGSRRIAGFDSQFLVLGGLEPDGVVRLLSPDRALADGAIVA